MYTYFTVYNHQPFAVFLSVERSNRKKVNLKQQHFFLTFKPALEHALQCIDENLECLHKNLTELEKTKISLASKTEASLMKKLLAMENFQTEILNNAELEL